MAQPIELESSNEKKPIPENQTVIGPADNQLNFVNQIGAMQNKSLIRIVIFTLLLFAAIVSLYKMLNLFASENLNNYKPGDESLISATARLELETLHIDKFSADKLQSFAPNFPVEYDSRKNSLLNMSTEELRQEVEMTAFGAYGNYSSIRIGPRIRNFYSIQPANDAPDFTNLVSSNNNLTDLEIRLTDIPSDLLTRLKKISPNKEITLEVIYNNFYQYQRELKSYYFDDQFMIAIQNIIRGQILEYDTKLELNQQKYKELIEKIDAVETGINDKIRYALLSKSDAERYAIIIQRASISFILIAIALAMLYQISREAVLVSKLQSVSLLAAGLGFKTEDLDLFDAMDRLHAYKGNMDKSKEFSEMMSYLKQKG